MQGWICDLCRKEAYITDATGKLCKAHWDEKEAARNAENKRLTEKAGGPWPQTCPRRMLGLGPWEREENLDTWDIRDQFANGVIARHCSFCGSLHPDSFMQGVLEGWEIIPTDKNYKAYIRDQGGKETKFYFDHLSQEQQQEFVERVRDGSMRIATPGYFYRLPFFASHGVEQDRL